MGGHRNLSPELKRLIENGKDEEVTLDLRTVSEGDEIQVTMETGKRFNFTIISPAKEKLHGVDDSAYAYLPGKQWSNDCKQKVKVLIGGACTFNPGAPLGMSMIHMGHLSMGRNFVMWKGDTNSAVIQKKTIATFSVKSGLLIKNENKSKGMRKHIRKQKAEKRRRQDQALMQNQNLPKKAPVQLSIFQ